MTVPKTSVNENYSTVFWKHQIRRTRQALVVNQVPESQAMKCSSEDHLGLRVRMTDSSHYPRTRHLVDGIHECLYGYFLRREVAPFSDR